MHQTVTQALLNAGKQPSTHALDFVKGNVKARQRMIAQYEIAGLNKGLVVGTDHSVRLRRLDLAPLSKRQVRLLRYC